MRLHFSLGPVRLDLTIGEVDDEEGGEVLEMRAETEPSDQYDVEPMGFVGLHSKTPHIIRD